MRLYSAQHIVKVDGKTGLFRGLAPRVVSSVLSTVVRGKVRQVKLHLHTVSDSVNITIYGVSTFYWIKITIVLSFSKSVWPTKVSAGCAFAV